MNLLKKYIDIPSQKNVFKDWFDNKKFDYTITLVIILAGIIVGLQTSKEINAIYGDLLAIIDHITNLTVHE